MYQVTKKYGHERGLSCAFRQWRAKHSHCQYIHGYSIAVELTFEAETLDDRNWVIDFGGLDFVKSFLEETFDHKLLVAQDDPQLEMFLDMADAKIADVLLVPAVGCEKFAEMIFDEVKLYLDWKFKEFHARLVKVQVWEHPSNSAVYTGKQ